MNYLLTGGRGLVASLFAKRLHAEGHHVTIIDDGNDSRHYFNSFPGPIYYDLRLERFTPRVLADIVSNCDRVFHAAASTGIPYSAEEPLDDWQRNVDGTIALLEALRKTPKPTVVLSSVKPYGLERLGEGGKDLGADSWPPWADAPIGVNEDFPLEPDEPYAASKAAQSMICMAYARSYGIPLVTYRCSNLFGNAAPHGARHGWLTAFCIRAALGWPIEIQGDGSQRRDMLFASDVAEAALLGWEHIEKLSGKVFNLGGGPANVISVAGAYDILRQFGSKSPSRQGPGRKHEDQLFVTNTFALLVETGWQPKVSTPIGMRVIYDWARENAARLAQIYAGEK